MTITAGRKRQPLGAMLREKHRAATEQFEAQIASAMHLRTSGQEPGDAADLGAYAAESEEVEMVTAALAQQVLRLDEALKRHGSGHWGRCEGCDTEIPAERLEIMPWVTQCVPCQQRREHHVGKATDDLRDAVRGRSHDKS